MPGETGTWDLIKRAAPPALADYVINYQGYYDTTGAYRQITIPGGAVVLILNLGDPYVMQNAAEAAPKRFDSFLAGLNDVPGWVEPTGLSAGIQVNLTPVGAHLLTGLPMHVLTNEVLDVEEAFGPAARELMERLREATTWGVRFQVLDRFIQARLLASSARPEAMVWAYGVLKQTGGAASIASLAGSLGYSQKQLIAHFRTQLGLTPKTMARVMRFERAVGLIRRERSPDWAQVVVECGYYDQPHLIRDFREFSGMTPGEYVSRLRPPYDNIMEPVDER